MKNIKLAENTVDSNVKLHISGVSCSLSYQPSYVETVCEGVFFRIKAPLIFSADVLAYAGIFSLLDKKHTFEYYCLKYLSER